MTSEQMKMAIAAKLNESKEPNSISLSAITKKCYNKKPTPYIPLTGFEL